VKSTCISPIQRQRKYAEIAGKRASEGNSGQQNLFISTFIFMMMNISKPQQPAGTT
jgi:hypothetical protein